MSDISIVGKVPEMYYYKGCVTRGLYLREVGPLINRCKYNNNNDDIVQDNEIKDRLDLFFKYTDVYRGALATINQESNVSRSIFYNGLELQCMMKVDEYKMNHTIVEEYKTKRIYMYCDLDIISS